jgi:hypothetical protein
MKRTTILVTLVALLSGCDNVGSSLQQGGENTASAEVKQDEKAAEGTINKISSEQILDIFLKIPAADMPKELKTEQQRKDVWNDVNSGVENVNEQENRIEWLKFIYDGACYNCATIACYPADDGKKIVVIFLQGEGCDVGTSYKVDCSFEYNIASGELAKINRPMDTITEDEVIGGNITAEQSQALLESFNTKPMFDYTIDKYGFEVSIRDVDVIDPYDDSIHLPSAIRKWNGKRFVKN